MAGDELKQGDHVEVRVTGVAGEKLPDGTRQVMFDSESGVPGESFGWVSEEHLTKIAPPFPKSFGSVIRSVESGTLWIRDAEYWNSTTGNSLPTSGDETFLRNSVGAFEVLRVGLGLPLDDTSDEE